MSDPIQPIIPPAPWYTSPSQVSGVVAGLAQVASILIRMFGLPVTEAQVDGYAADALQLITLGAGMWAMIHRQQSVIAPLTMTRKGADALTQANPPLLPSDPSKK